MIRPVLVLLVAAALSVHADRPGGGRKKKPEPQRPTAATSRGETSGRFSGLFARGGVSSKELSQTLAAGSTGALPASAKSREALSASLATALEGKKLGTAQAGALSDALATASNADSLTKEELAAKRASLKASLAAAGATTEQQAQVAAAFDQVVSEQQQQNLLTLKNDLVALQAESAVTQAQIQALSTSLMAMADGATKPSQELVTALATDLSAALDDGDLTAMEQATLARDLEAVLDSANIPPSELEAVLKDVQAILVSSNVDKADVQKIVADLQAIYAAMRKPTK